MKGMIFNIQRFSVEDGPGIRTTVFFKGCPLSCPWCHNPESRKKGPEISFDAEKCVLCGACEAVCPRQARRPDAGRPVFLRERCGRCGECARVCPAQALEVVGREVSADEVMKEVLADREFYRHSGGGMTLSGGEPMAQPAFALALARAAADEGVGVCVETCGFCPSDALLRVAEFTDLFYYDFKLADSRKHERYTGVPLEPILANLRRLDGGGHRTVLRCPMIPGVNMDEAHLEGIVRLAGTLRHCAEIHLEPYHPLGLSKCGRLGIPPLFTHPSFTEKSELEPMAARVREQTGLPVSIL